MTATAPRKDQRVEFRVSAVDRELFARAAAAAGTDLSTFATTNLRLAAQRALADRTQFTLSAVETEAWEELLSRPPRDLAGLRALLDRPSPFVD
ncbi:DUF1778 domain-containing protein [Demequina pelophila]|uniref:type II toxin-antitoxin system TacA family antitoxin n=1 Tax=Demequina pelophila TaxID=1638984 RepID=UPI0007818F98|nr:DUF1778 domain-containing protein [Demequina pelophila]